MAHLIAHPHARLSLAVATLGAGLLGPVSAQREIVSLVGPTDGSRYGHALTGIDDVDGDGRPDVVFSKVIAGGPGRLNVSSGADLSHLFWIPVDPGFRPGRDLLTLGDVTGDGRREFITIGEAASSARVRMYDGLTGDTIVDRDLMGLGIGTQMELKLVGDVDGDELPDFLATDTSQHDGPVHVLSGADLSDVRQHGPPTVGMHCKLIDGGRDVDDDGVGDYVICWRPVGSLDHVVEVFSGASGVRTNSFLATADYLPCQQIALVPDVDGDDRADVVFVDIESPFADPRPYVFSSTTGALIMAPPSLPETGPFWDMTQADVDGDGVDDFLMGYSRTEAGVRFVVYTGGDFALRYEAVEPYFEYACFLFVANMGDVDGDGIDDFATACESFSTNQPSLPQDANNRGLIALFSGTGASPLGTVSCGSAKVNSTGRPGQLLVHGSPSVAVDDLRLTARDLPPREFGYFLASPQLDPMPLPGSQGDFCLGTPLAAWRDKTMLSDAFGAIAIRVDTRLFPTSPPVPVLAGETWHFQAWYRDRDTGETSRFTEAIELTFE